MRCYPVKFTPLTPLEVLEGLRQAWEELWSESPSKRSLQVLLAQWALETGRGRACIHYNLGNVKASAEQEHTFFRTTEWLPLKSAEPLLIDPRVKLLSQNATHAQLRFEPDHPACRFRAFSTLHEGCVEYLKLLRHRFASAWPAVLAGDAAQFAQLLKQARYYTVDEKPYREALVSLCTEFGRLPVKV